MLIYTTLIKKYKYNSNYKVIVNLINNNFVRVVVK